jgi:RNA polymerase sigma-70 factor (ECF subfamily)
MDSNAAWADRLEEFRSYLRLLAAVQLPATLRARLEPADLVQDTLVEAVRDLAQFRGNSKPELAGWLRRILSRNVRDRARKEFAARRDINLERSLEAALDRSSARIEQWLALAELGPAAQAEREEQLRRLADALGQLADDQRTVIELKHLQGWSVAAVADHMKRSPTAVAGLLRRGLERLRELLAEEP